MSDEDPFECRLIFGTLLTKLNASQQSIHKVANFAVKHRRLSEDLYSCLKEELERASINARLNMMYALDAIFSQSCKAKFTGYLDLSRDDLPRIVEAVVPNDTIVNLNNARKILKNWNQRNYFDAGVIDTIIASLEARAPNGTEEVLSKQDILRRIEEDRERHKRLREDIWIRPTGESIDVEFEEMWASTDAFDPILEQEEIMRQNKCRLPHYAWDALLSPRATASNADPSSSDLPLD